MFRRLLKRKLKAALKELKGAEWTDGRYAKVLELVGKYAKAYLVRIQMIHEVTGDEGRKSSLIPITTWIAPGFLPQRHSTLRAVISREGATVGFIELEKKQNGLLRPAFFPKQIEDLVLEVANQLGDGKIYGISFTHPILPPRR